MLVECPPGRVSDLKGAEVCYQVLKEIKAVRLTALTV